MVLVEPRRPLELRELPDPQPQPGQVLLRVRACGVCRTDLHVADGDLPDPKLPLVLGHEIVGIVEEGGGRLAKGTRAGVPWLGWTCGECTWCRSGRENLCDRARFTGYHLDGGDAGFAGAEAAPLLCAGLIGYRSLRMAGDPRRLGLYGFGAAAHLVAQVARAEGREVYAFTSPGDLDAQRLALDLGAVWAGSSLELPPAPLDAAILFAPVGALVPQALRAVRKAGVVVCGGIHMSDIPSFPYRLLWEERVVRSVANLTRRDAEEFLALAARVPLEVRVTPHPLERANVVLTALRAGRIVGAAALVP